MTDTLKGQISNEEREQRQQHEEKLKGISPLKENPPDWLSTMAKNEWIRIYPHIIELPNQALIMFGKPVLPISEDQVNTLTETLYLAFSMVFTLVTTLVAWFKNNYVTSRGKAQKEALQQKGLTK
ncbi:phage holin [Bacillus altitudinis C101]|nr:phage holin [Bacillus altitudinis C101]